LLDKIFLQILNLSFTASFVIAAVLVARLVLKKAPKIFSYVLWSVVLFRLVCPLTFESVLSLLPINSATVSMDILSSRTPNIDTGIGIINNAVDSALPDLAAGTGASPVQIWVFLSEIIWLTGLLCLLLYRFVSLAKLRARLVGAVKQRENIYLSDNICSPFVMGVIQPKIYLPSTLGEKEQGYIILHEQTHIRRFDHIIKIVSFGALCIHWFNPLVWLAFILCARDMEMACDESVIKDMDADIRIEYSSSLLSLATGKKIIAGAPLAFGEGDTKGRIKNVLNYKKPAFWVIIVALIAVAAVCVGLLSDPPKEQTTKISFPAYQEGKKDYNERIYDVEPFTLAIDLPEGWTVKLPAEEERKTSYAFTPVYLFKGETFMGSIGYNVFELYEDTTEENFYRSVYNQLMLGSMYNWNREYTPVRETENSCSATCRIMTKTPEKGQSAAAADEVFLPGVLSYNIDMLVYVAIQLEEDAVTDEQLKTIAESINLSR